MVGEGAQVLCGGSRGKFSKLGARSGPRTRSAHLIPSRSDILLLLMVAVAETDGHLVLMYQ